MALIVQKFGGSSVGTMDRIRNVARRIHETAREGNQVVAVVSAMGEHGADYADALAQAQKLGFAEEDPALDVNGWDAAHKALILAMLAYGTTISPDKIYVRDVYKRQCLLS